jgi:anaerobic dimethyl sulfoxide reductase subunit C
MNLHDWSLILFTILAQMAVGAFVVLGIVHFLAVRQAGKVAADRLSDLALLAIGPVLLLGLGASLFHLGSPWLAYRAIFNVGSSWLSREILFGTLFAASGGLFAILQWRKIGTFAVRNVIAVIAALLGLALVYSMAQVYMMRTVPVWNSWATPLSFYVTTFLLGGLALAAAFVTTYRYVRREDPGCAQVQCELLRTALRGIAIGSIVFLGIQFVTGPWYVAALAAGSPTAVASAALFTQPYGLLFGLRLALVFVGAGVIALFLYRSALNSEQERLMGNLAYLAFVLVLVAELMGRFLFYATYLRIGV